MSPLDSDLISTSAATCGPEAQPRVSEKMDYEVWVDISYALRMGKWMNIAMLVHQRVYLVDW